jgi:outer membrane protein assembly factor BamA
MRIRSVLIVALLPSLGAWQTAAAQTYFPDTISFSGSTLSQEQLLAYTGLRPGSVTKEQMQAASDKLTRTGLFIRAIYELDDDVLRYTLTPSPAVLPVRYDNFPWWDAKTLNALVAQKVPLFGGAVYPGGPMRQQVLDALTELVAAKGVRAKIGATPVGDAQRTMIATAFHIDSPPVVIASLTVEGAGAAWADSIREIENSAAGKEYTKGSLDSLTAALRDVYARRGYLDVAIDGPSWGTPQIEDRKIVAPLTAKITSEGQPYTVSAVHFAGNAMTSAEAFAKDAKIHTGDVADADTVQAAVDLLKAPWKDKGYEDVAVKTGAAPDRGQHTVAYTFTVDPGPVYHMGTLTLIGLNKRQEQQVLAYWQVPKGAVYQPALIPAWRALYLQERAGELVVFEQLEHMVPEYESQPHGDTHVVDVVVRFKPPNVAPQPLDFHPNWH